MTSLKSRKTWDPGTTWETLSKNKALLNQLPGECNVHERQKGRRMGSARNLHGNAFHYSLKGVFQSSPANNQGRHLVLAMPDGVADDVYAFQFVLYNDYEEGAVDYIAKFHTQDAIGDGIYNAGPWTSLTLNGSTTLTSPARVGANYGRVFTDIVYGVPLKKYLAIRTFAADNTTRVTLHDDFGLFTAGPTGTLLTRGITSAKQTVDIVTNPAAFTTPVYDDDFPGVSLICYTRSQVYRAAVFGNSPIIGYGDDGDVSWQNRCFKLSCLDGGPILTFANKGDPNDTTKIMMDRFDHEMGIDADYDEIQVQISCADDKSEADYIAGLPGGATPGDFTVYATRMKGYCLKMINECAKRGIACRIIINRERDATGAELAMMREIMQFIRDLEADGACFTHDMVQMFNVEGASSATYLYPSEFPDGIHPNGAAQQRQATIHLAKVRSGL